jgi:hypothetical protein
LNVGGNDKVPSLHTPHRKVARNTATFVEKTQLSSGLEGENKAGLTVQYGGLGSGPKARFKQRRKKQQRSINGNKPGVDLLEVCHWVK